MNKYLAKTIDGKDICKLMEKIALTAMKGDTLIIKQQLYIVDRKEINIDTKEGALYLIKPCHT